MENNRKPCVAALDVGTSSVKVCLFSENLELISRSVQEYALDTRGSQVEANGGIYLDAVRAGIREATEQTSGYEVAAISVTTQGETFAPVDENGNPLRPFIVWLDDRAQEQAEALKAKLQTLLGKTVELTFKVDASCMGGVLLELPGKQMDGTVKHRLESVAAALKNAAV